VLSYYFFFSSRRRHTISKRDWSSDVCSSDLLSGAPFDVRFISFEDVKNDPHLLDEIDVLINVGDADTAHTGGVWWEDPEVSSAKIGRASCREKEELWLVGGQ